MKLTRSHEGLI